MNISYSEVNKDEITESCESINAKPFATKSSAMFVQTRSFLMEFASNTDVWSDFVGTGATINDYVNGNSNTSIELGINSAWIDSVSFGSPCVKMAAAYDYHLEPSECTGKAKFICIRYNCPKGFTWFDGKSCIKIMDEKSSKPDGVQKCKTFNSRAKKKHLSLKF